jgi:hypothetical protein
MTAPVRFPYKTVQPALGPAGVRPMLPLVFSSAVTSLAVDGLLDTGAGVNVLPFSVGNQLGLDWNKQPFATTLSGALANVPARGVVLMAAVAAFSPVQLAFAWAQSDVMPVLLGQMNFFLEFEACFFRAQAAFEVKPK